jgi:hypothetical protein
VVGCGNGPTPARYDDFNGPRFNEALATLPFGRVYNSLKEAAEAAQKLPPPTSHPPEIFAAIERQSAARVHAHEGWITVDLQASMNPTIIASFAEGELEVRTTHTIFSLPVDWQCEAIPVEGSLL